MRTTLFLLSIILQFAVEAQSIPAKLDELVTTYVNAARFNGTVLIAKKDNILLHKGYGYRDVARKLKTDKNTIFQIGSITKQFTSTIILQLQEEKKLSVSDKLSKYFPDYPNGDDITIEHLMTHTSGIFNYAEDPAFINNAVFHPANRKEMLSFFRDRPLKFKPGSKAEYSNSGYILLGYIIEDVTGKHYGEVLRERIFHPLLMNNSGIDFARLRSANKATPYKAFNANGALPTSDFDSSTSYAAGAIYSTTGDLYKWHKGLYGEKMLKNASLEKAYTVYQSGYGYGWVIRDEGSNLSVSHQGGTLGFSAYFERIPREDICIILLANIGNNPLTELATNIRAVLNNQPIQLPKQRIPLVVSPKELKNYAGSYRVNAEITIVISLEGNKLMAQATGRPRMELFAEKENFFFVKEHNAQIEFIKEQNQVVKLLLFEGGQRIEAQKIK